MRRARTRERHKLTDTMNLIKSKGFTILCVLIGLLASSQAADDAAALQLRLDLLKNHYRELCHRYSELAANFSTPVSIRCTECPDGWLHVGDQCFFLATDRQNWATSTDLCKEVGSHLAKLTNNEEHDAVGKEGRRIGGTYTHYWIGANDMETEGHWKWPDNSSVLENYWRRLGPLPQPDNAGEKGEDCVVLNSVSQTWDDVPCSFLYPRICQKDATPLGEHAVPPALPPNQDSH